MAIGIVSATGKTLRRLPEVIILVDVTQVNAAPPSVNSHGIILRPGRWTGSRGSWPALDVHGLRRRLSTRSGPQAARVTLDGRELINFGSNDYLGLAADPRLSEAVAQAVGQEGWGSGASPLLTGHAALHAQLEQRLAEMEGAEAALVFPSGFAANLGTIAALVGPGDAVFADAKNHASLLDGCRLSRADVRIYPHCDWQRLDDLLAGSARRISTVAG